MNQVETLIHDFERAVCEYLFIAEECERIGESTIFILPLGKPEGRICISEDGSAEHPEAELMANLADRVLELGKQLGLRLESLGIDTRELRRFQRAVRLWQPKEASSLWDDLEIYLERIGDRLQLRTDTKPVAHTADEPPAEETKKKAKRRKPGRPISNEKEKDERWYDAWKSNRWKDLRELADALGITKKELEKGIDRHRQELNKQRKEREKGAE